MTETVPERVWLDENSMDCDGFYLCEAEKRHVNMEHEYVPATALEAAQARIVELQDKVLLAYNLAKKADDFRKTARAEALEEAAKVNWVEAPYVPREWEGRQAWKYVDIANSPSRRVTLDTVPHDYSRDEDHCGGVWFALFTPPAPPPRALMEKPNG